MGVRFFHKQMSPVYVKLTTGIAKTLVPQTLTFGTFKDYSRIDDGVFNVTANLAF